VVSLSGQDFYLGPHGTKASKAEYDRQIAEWLARGRRPLHANDIEIVELILAYKEYAEGYYRKNGRKTSEVVQILLALKVLRKLYGRQLANEFGPLKLQVVRDEMIRAGGTGRNINKLISRIVRMFAWGVSRELVRADAAHALRELPGLRAGRSEAKEAPPVQPVADTVVTATLDHLPPIVADMVRLQRLTGCRPAEICLIRPCDVDLSGSVWTYRLESHKTMHHGRERVICIGPKGQEILRPYLLREKSSYCFCPREGERKRRAAAHERRLTSLSCGNRPGSNKRKKAKRWAGVRYTTGSYGRAIRRACLSAAIEPWSPNRLRHSAATEIRKRFGLEAAQVTLGHAQATVTQVYAERDFEKAASVMAQVG
jgi:integrase